MSEEKRKFAPGDDAWLVEESARHETYETPVRVTEREKREITIETLDTTVSIPVTISPDHVKPAGGGGKSKSRFAALLEKLKGLPRSTPRELKIGDEVTITEGPLEGWKGRIIDIRDYYTVETIPMTIERVEARDLKPIGEEGED